jgi:hypothetical protein
VLDRVAPKDEGITLAAKNSGVLVIDAYVFNPA